LEDYTTEKDELTIVYIGSDYNADSEMKFRLKMYTYGGVT
jgi:hypothetical protein